MVLASSKIKSTLFARNRSNFCGLVEFNARTCVDFVVTPILVLFRCLPRARLALRAPCPVLQTVPLVVRRGLAWLGLARFGSQERNEQEGKVAAIKSLQQWRLTDVELHNFINRWVNQFEIPRVCASQHRRLRHSSSCMCGFCWRGTSPCYVCSVRDSSRARACFLFAWSCLFSHTEPRHVVLCMFCSFPTCAACRPSLSTGAIRRA